MFEAAFKHAGLTFPAPPTHLIGTDAGRQVGAEVVALHLVAINRRRTTGRLLCSHATASAHRPLMFEMTNQTTLALLGAYCTAMLDVRNWISVLLSSSLFSKAAAETACCTPCCRSCIGR